MAIEFPLILSRSGAFTDSVEFRVNGLPPGATGEFKAVSVAGGGSNVLTVKTGPDLRPGSYPFSIGYSGKTFAGEEISKTMPLSLSVTAP